MTHAGTALIVKAAVIVGLIVVGALIRTFIGSSARRGQIMCAWMVVGIAVAVIASYVVPASLHVRESALVATFGLLVGAGIGWRVARDVPRESR